MCERPLYLEKVHTTLHTPAAEAEAVECPPTPLTVTVQPREKERKRDRSLHHLPRREGWYPPQTHTYTHTDRAWLEGLGEQ